MPTATASRRKATPPRDLVREEILKLMQEKDVTPKDLIEKTGMSKNSIYEFINGKRGMRSGNSSQILLYLRAKKVRAKPSRIGSPSADN